MYVDEVQDLTNAELALLLKMSKSGSLFLAGDPAQSVEAGVDFRFDEVRSMFYKLTTSVPERPTILHLNFRSHAGILEAAGSILDWLLDFFMGSVERLPHDQGLCKGPRPAMGFWEMQGLVDFAVQNPSSGLVILTPDHNKKGLEEKLAASELAASSMPNLVRFAGDLGRKRTLWAPLSCVGVTVL